MKTRLSFSLPPGPLRVGMIEAGNTRIGPSPREYLALIEKEVKHVLDKEFIYPDHLRKGIRSLLKVYGFHPSGRNRPASEFLAKDLQMRGQFNPINNAVDINNHLSLLSHLPISILDGDKTGSHLCIRVGMEDEKYVFNREGQDLALKGLLVIASGGHDNTPFGSPVKDSQATKIFETTKSLIGVVYTSQNITPRDDLSTIMKRFAELLKTFTAGIEITWDILDAPNQ